MRVALFLVIALLLAMIQHAVIATWGWGPDLVLAWCVYLVGAGGLPRSVPYAWSAGLAHDIVDPGSWYFHTIVYLLLALATRPLFGMLMFRPGLALGLLAASWHILVQLIDGSRSGWVGPGITATLIDAVATGLVAVALGWLAEGLPEKLRPTDRIVVQRH